MKLLRRISFVIRASRAGRGQELDTMIAGMEANSRPMGSVPADEAWMPAKAWNMASKRITAQVRDKEWAAICSGSNGLVSLVTLAKPLDGPYEVSFYQGHANELAAVLKSSAPVAYDPWRDTSNAMVLAKAGIKMVEFRNSIANMSEPMFAARDFVCAGLLHHAGDPVLTEHVLNVIDRCRVTRSLTRTHYPRRRQGQRIDGAVALIMAVGLALNENRQDGRGGMNIKPSKPFDPAVINAVERRFLENRCFPAHQLPPESSLSVHDLELVSSRTFETLELPRFFGAHGSETGTSEQ